MTMKLDQRACRDAGLSHCRVHVFGRDAEPRSGWVRERGSGTAGATGTGGGTAGTGTGTRCGGAGTGGSAGAAQVQRGARQARGTEGLGAAGSGAKRARPGARGRPTSRCSKRKAPVARRQLCPATLTAAAAMTVMPNAPFNTAASFTGQMFASPLYLANGPAGKGIFIAATSNNE